MDSDTIYFKMDGALFRATNLRDHQGNVEIRRQGGSNPLKMSMWDTIYRLAHGEYQPVDQFQAHREWGSGR